MAGERDGNWLDPSGCCKICDGEIPHGHTNNCDIWKLEQQLAAERQRAEKAEEAIKKMDESEKDFETSYWRCLADLKKTEGQLFTVNKQLLSTQAVIQKWQEVAQKIIEREHDDSKNHNETLSDLAKMIDVEPS